MSFPFYKQLNAMDCGPTCLRMVSKYYGKHYNADKLRQKTGYSKEGVSLLGISETAESIGFRTRGMKITLAQLAQVQLPCILHWEQNHFVVLTDISKKKAIVADPGKNIVSYSMDEFLRHWISSDTDNGQQTGIALLLEPSPYFYETMGEKERKLSWKLVLQYLAQSRFQLIQVFTALALSSLLQLAVPFLTQTFVDNGINGRNLQYVVIVLLAQLMLSFSQTVIGFIRGRLMLRISNILNLQILSDFWIKLTRLPVSYFDVHHTGDTLQRIGDHKTIQSFLTGTTLNLLFSMFTFIVYAAVLVTYSTTLFILLVIGSAVSFGWVRIFMPVRRKINYESFHLSSKENTATLQLIQGMQEIRLNNAEKQKRWDWENIQAAVFKLNFKGLNYSQLQSAGGLLINQAQSIAISFVVAKLVIDGKLTLGGMMAVQYIIGQVSGPLGLWIGFVQSAQDAKISMERLNEIHQLPDEEDPERSYLQQLPNENKSIYIDNLSFAYPGSGNDPVLENINLQIPQGKVTAIVGVSGSGKTTLLKILLKIYDRYEGKIRLKSRNNENGDDIRFEYIGHGFWRGMCGAVMQDGYIFNDTIARNIAVGTEDIDYQKLVDSCKMANIHSFVQSLPNSFHTQLGSEGIGISQGQKQRLLIARAIYKNPHYIFFDEATNALDANNEREIVDNLSHFFKNRTVVIVAHRLSTVRNADKIVVLQNGKIVEEGTHESLSYTKGKYYELVKNQLELGL